MKNKALYLLALLALSTLIFNACEDDDEIKKTTFDNFAIKLPNSWTCSVEMDSFSVADIPNGLYDPIAVLKYNHPSRECKNSGPKLFRPSLTLNFYAIEDKPTLLEIIDEQKMHSSCIPIYYGETKTFFVISSPCYIVGASCMTDLTDHLKEKIETKTN